MIGGLEAARGELRDEEMSFGVENVEHRDRRALFGHARDGRGADADAAAGDDGDLTLQATHVRPSLCWWDRALPVW